jgi:hypothetical protein
MDGPRPANLAEEQLEAIASLSRVFEREGLDFWLERAAGKQRRHVRGELSCSHVREFVRLAQRIDQLLEALSEVVDV